MIVYCDTSFLVSFLYEGDANHKAARELAGRFDGEDFVLCQTHQLELPASVRAATHRAESPIPIHVARTIINRFDRAWNGRAFVRRDLSLDDSVMMARSLGETHGWVTRAYVVRFVAAGGSLDARGRGFSHLRQAAERNLRHPILPDSVDSAHTAKCGVGQLGRLVP